MNKEEAIAAHRVKALYGPIVHTSNGVAEIRFTANPGVMWAGRVSQVELRVMEEIATFTVDEKIEVVWVTFHYLTINHSLFRMGDATEAEAAYKAIARGLL